MSLHDRIEAAVRERMAVAQAAGAEWRNVGIVTTGLPAFVAPDAVAQHVAANDPARILRDCAEDLDVLGRHRPCACDLSREIPHCVTHRCPARAPHAEVLSLGRRYGITEEVDGDG